MHDQDVATARTEETDPGWVISQTAYVAAEEALYASLFCLSNGVLSARMTVDFENDAGRPGTFHHRYFDNAPGVTREIVNLPNWLPVRYAVGDQRLSGGPTSVVSYHRRLDLRTAHCTSVRILQLSDGRRLRITEDHCVLADPTDVAISTYTVTALGWSDRLAVHADFDDRFGNAYLGTRATWLTHHNKVHRFYRAADGSVVLDGSNLSGDAAFRMSSLVRGLRFVETSASLRRWSHIYRARLVANEPLTFTRITRVTVSDRPLSGDVALLADFDLDRALAAHSDDWRRRWDEYDIAIDGDPRAQAGMRFSLFHMQQAVRLGADEQRVPARGLTSEYHSGLQFFDVELYTVPCWALMEPGVAAGLIRHRVRGLDAARAYAAQTGYAGARFPEAENDRGAAAGPFEIVDPIGPRLHPGLHGDGLLPR